MRSLPRIDANYWLTLAGASVFGTNTGDFVAGRLHLGHLAGLPVLAALFGLILLVERRAVHPSAMYFWAAIITMRTAATNVGDAFQDYGFGLAISVPFVLGLFAISVLAYGRVARPAQGSTVAVTPLYWVSMMLAGILGTVGGDWAASFLTAPGATAAFLVLTALAIAYFSKTDMLLKPGPYWLVVALVRTGGTAAGDSLAHALRLSVSTLLTGLAFSGLVIYFYSRRPNRDAKASA